MSDLERRQHADRRTCATGGRRSTDVVHGTRPAYQKGCRCTPCTVANADYCRQWWQAKQKGTPVLGARVNATRTHILMKMIRSEGVSHGALDAALGWSGNYARVRKARHLSLRTALKVLRFYRLRVADAGAQSEHVAET